ncbi:MAG: hypothetical protein IKB98_06415 [Clostridia bacterium]|nr:hypothetical protein [Clostridia bacterium]
MTMTTKNSQVKAFSAHLASEKKSDPQTLLEWCIALNTNAKRGAVYNQNDLLNLYGRSTRNCKRGASKTCHVKDHNGNAFKYIVIKRHQVNGYIDEHAFDPNTKQTGNQLIDEIACYNEFVERAESDFLCPILKYFTSKSDKVNAISETMQRNVVIISQRAVFVGDLEDACYKAEELNAEENKQGANANERYRKMYHFAESQGWRDAVYNGGNCGVIYDYEKKCYKAVFIDYAL